jgi:hypothetical protein
MKTINEIHNEIDTAYQAAYGLDGTQMSNASDWKIFRGIFAQVLYVLYQFFALFKKEVTDIAAASEYGNPAWWHQTMLNFQEGYSLSVINGKVVYAVQDEAAKIIKRVAAPEVFDGQKTVVQLKLAKEVSGVPVPLSGSQLLAAQLYANQKKPAGVDTQVISIAADLVKTIETIYYDGKLDLDSFQDSLVIARNNYLSSIVFDGQFNVNRYRDALEAVPGVIDVDLISVNIKPNGGAYSLVSRTYSPLSGYYSLAVDDCTFNFVAQ